MVAFSDIYGNGKLKLVGQIEYLKDDREFKKLKAQLYTKGWVVNVRPPFSKASTVIEYLSRYLNRVAITNNRILKIEDEKVTFKWKDNRDGKDKIMILEVMEFIRRFLLHILPERFVKIRYYGFLSNSQRREKIAKIRRLLRHRIKKIHCDFEKQSKESNLAGDNTKLRKENKRECPVCKGVMEIIREFLPTRASPANSW